MYSNSSMKLFIFEGEGFLLREAALPPPHKMDENMWKNREHIEEILFLLNKSRWPRSVQYQFLIGCLPLRSLLFLLGIVCVAISSSKKSHRVLQFLI